MRLPSRLVLAATLTLVPVAAQAEKRDYPAYAVDVPTAEHYKWGNGNEGWYMVKQDDMSVIQQRMEPGNAEINHIHRKARQFFYVLSGELTINVEGEDTVLKPGQGMEIEPRRVHQARNASAAPVDFLVMSTPPSLADRAEVAPVAPMKKAPQALASAR